MSDTPRHYDGDTPRGEHPVDEETRRQIVDDFRSGALIVDLIEQYKVSRTMVTKILREDHYT